MGASPELGSPTLVINTSDETEVLLAAEYSAFGEQRVLAGNAEVIPFGFAGGRYDRETGLVRFGARDYEPVTGRWTGKDPIRFEGGQGNIYVYLGNDPVNATDPSGTYIWPLNPILCLYYEWQASEAMDDCLKQVADAWSTPGDDGIAAMCSLDGGSPTAQYYNCLVNKHSDAVNNMLKWCTRTAANVASGNAAGQPGVPSIPGRRSNFNLRTRGP